MILDAFDSVLTWLGFPNIMGSSSWDEGMPSKRDTIEGAIDRVLALTPLAGVETMLRDAARVLLDPPAAYYYARPGTDTIKAGDIHAAAESGLDCSGEVLTVAVYAGQVSPEWAETHRSSASLAAAMSAVGLGSQVPGDVAYYPGHVATVLTHPDESGHSWCLTMSGGTESTKGDNPNAHAKVARGDYRSDFVCYMRFPTNT